MDSARQKIIDRNALFKEHAPTIDSLRDALLREMNQLVDEFSLNEQQAASVAAYMNDRVTLFRFLLRNAYSLPTTLSLVLGNIRWRIKHNIDTLAYTTLPSQLFENPFVFFHKQDKLQRPVLVINVQYLPKFDSNEFADQLRPFMILIMEMGRKLTRDITKVREERGEDLPLVQDLVIIVNLANAGRVPMDKRFGQILIDLVSTKYPAMVGSVHVLNFGWMYQGIWQMIKLVMTENARQKVSFPKAAELATIVDKEDILKDFDGADDYVWSLESDTVLQKYGTPYTKEDADADAVVPSIPRSISSRRSSVSSDIFYDAMSDMNDANSLNTLSRSLSTFSMYGTPTGGRTPALTPVSSSLALSKIPIPLQSARAVDYSSLAYLKNWFSVVASTLSQPKSSNPSIPDITLNDHSRAMQAFDRQHHDGFAPHDDDAESDDGLYLSPRTSNALSPPQTPIPTGYSGGASTKSEFIRYWLIFQSKCRKGLHKLTKLMFRYHSALYWVLVYLLLRGGVTELINYTLQATVKLIAANGGLGEGAGLHKQQGVVSRIFSSLMEEFPGRLAL
ncbi:hypothetical protein K450DRAFT_282783 [Umbelopsis ramanniana AG]|uniref:CRAL-TRIO domain-containing protein n=1 Tax=Umbelopsis ramanniana AG TaxID=1314678 RepID=A0AAD5HBX1_UMBRA|nr:uncharacterized protein K450DRAFT_282783 [Umbelopsis ramanniana AG]KAI8577274.1 hypothetical protein K450DRAFT_282783 [Umbelopsis ramanniana AG]